MKKLLIYLLILIFIVAGYRHLQKNDNRAIINNASGIPDPGIFGYYEGGDQNILYYSEEQGELKKLIIDADTKYLRLYVDDDNVLLKQEAISLSDFIQDQYIEIDVSRGLNDELPRALIIRQKIYVED